MKKLLCLLMVFILIFGLSSCKYARYVYLDTSSSDISDENTYDNSDISSEININASTPLFWKVTSDDSDGVIWLFGSIHVADESAYPLPDVIMSAFEASDALAVECDVENADFDYNKFYQSMLYKDGSTIDDHIPSEVFEEALKILEEKYGKQRVESFIYYKPIMWYMLIDEIYRSECELTFDYGLDSYFMDLADEDDKEILEIESLEFQYNMFLNFSAELQEFMLSDTINYTIEDYTQNIYNTYEAWKSGDIDYLEEMLLGEPPAGYYSKEELLLINEYNKAMIIDRNIGMFDTAEEYLADDMEVFYVVGEGHMLGEDGIVQLLTDAGYNVERIISYTGSNI
ncbi:MAG: hypothetical protein A2Y15_07875 [Clostridiales bacterium GWF2_36_10]|nr:MAG: hypothetical protein A2Y15_07875 [Clostridiales bacterium GWF2_36_10]HAN20673.1 hypothetical protein [Clostridiales bacterium]